MVVARALLNAKNIGVRRLKNKLSYFINKNELFIVTEYGSPAGVYVPYEEMMEIVDVLDELQDKEAIEAVAEGRKAVAAKRKGISVHKIFKKIRKK